jgi:galactose mutarotase-like enzyme
MAERPDGEPPPPNDGEIAGARARAGDRRAQRARAVSSVEGIETVELCCEDSRLHATFAAGAGMVCCSLRHDGDQLLAQRGGLRSYAERGSTMGIPLLHPWANRLSGSAYGVAPRDVELAPHSALVRRDANGLPIHGVIGARLPWRVIAVEHGAHGGSLTAELAWETPELLAVFPFPHRLAMLARVAHSTLTIETSLRPSGEVEVPVSFGYHPYLTLPGSDRRTWAVELPVTRRLSLDDRGIPTGAAEPFEASSLTLADSDWDDAFTGLTKGRPFVVSDARRRVELEFLEGYPYAQVFAPAAESFICFEPMSAPTNALVSRDGLRAATPGEVFRAAFRISIRDLA